MTSFSPSLAFIRRDIILHSDGDSKIEFISSNPDTTLEPIHLKFCMAKHGADRHYNYLRSTITDISAKKVSVPIVHGCSQKFTNSTTSSEPICRDSSYVSSSQTVTSPKKKTQTVTSPKKKTKFTKQTARALFEHKYTVRMSLAELRQTSPEEIERRMNIPEEVKQRVYEEQKQRAYETKRLREFYKK